MAGISAIGRLVGTSRAIERCGGNRDEHAKRTATAGDQQALGQQLPDQAFGSGSDGDAHGQLAAAPERARDEQMGEVHARDEQQAQRGARQRKQHLGAPAIPVRRAVARPSR